MLGLNVYSARARLQPALFVALPLAIAAVVWAPKALEGWGVLWGLVVWSGGAVFLAQVARDRGKVCESALRQKWGGHPSILLLQHQTTATVAQRDVWRAQIGRICTHIRLPTRDEEEKNPGAATELYALAVDHLVERMRDRKRFPLVFDELCSYGFRRNLRGMWPMGLALAVAGLLACGGAVAYRLWAGHAVPATAWTALCLESSLVAAWTLVITDAWVRRASDAYALRLLSTMSTIETPPPASK